MAQATPTRLEGEPGHWRLVRDGKPYFIKGVGGGGSMTRLKELGGNSVRTWGADDLNAQLDEAQRLGLTVCVGFWLGHEDRINAFNYDDPIAVAKQYEIVKAAILKYKDHPAVLMWGIGNEMEGSGDKAAIWSAVNDIAKLAKSIDPNHPTMTAIAEVGANGTKVKNLQKYCPDIDIIGINSYGGATSVFKRFVEAGVNKPYVLTEYGPIGFWEGGRTSFKAPIEPTSTEKAAMYTAAYDAAITKAAGTSLGGYAFLWGAKQETTATWFGMLLRDGRETESVASVAAAWNGKPLTHRWPKINAIRLRDGDRMMTGQSVTAIVDAASPDGRAVAYEWQLHRESVIRGEGGSYEPPTESIDVSLAKEKSETVRFRAPGEAGVYRLYVTATSQDGKVATANVSFVVDQAEPSKVH